MRNRMYGGVRGRKTKVGEKLLRFPPTRFDGSALMALQINRIYDKCSSRLRSRLITVPLA